MNRILVLLLLSVVGKAMMAQQPVPIKPRILISTDIGGTDPDDNQSMAHLLMYSNRFRIEGLVSSPSYGKGSKAEILRMIGLYEKDLPQLEQHENGFPRPDYLRAVTKQGQQGNAPYIGFRRATEGSDWIVECARRKSSEPLWVLVWGGLEDLAQALHDAPDIQKNIRVYWIGGPNKKWSANSYAYIVSHFPNLWFIENNASYYGFFSDKNQPDSISNTDYYSRHIQGGGFLGNDFKQYYQGEVKMGDTPSLLYMMDGDPKDPIKESWGGSFESLKYSPRVVFEGSTTIKDTIAFCAIIEFHFKGPEINVSADSVCFWMETRLKDKIQSWPGFYLGNGDYSIRYISKQAEILHYHFVSHVPQFKPSSGIIVVDNQWPGKKHATDYTLGQHYFTDKADPKLYDGKIQGGLTISKWRKDILQDWARRWAWLQSN